MDPISMMIIGGLALQAGGSLTGMFGASAANHAQQQELALQQQVEGQRQQAMELDANRRELETVRVRQRTNALALASATGQGAQRGSAIEGAYGQIEGQTGVNLLGISQNLEIGRNIFGINSRISDARVQEGNAREVMQLGQGLSSLGSSIVGSAGTANRVFSGPTNAAPQPFAQMQNTPFLLSALGST